jgi:hypothetical protein
VTEEPKQGVNRGNAGKGRPPGVPNKVNTALREAILAGTAEAGDELNNGGAVGYFKWLARKEPAAMAGLLGKVLPATLEGTGEDGKIVISWSAS